MKQKKLLLTSFCLLCFSLCSMQLAFADPTLESANDYFNLGKSLNIEKKYKAASDAFVKALTINPYLTDAKIEAARALMMNNQRDEACDFLKNKIAETKNESEKPSLIRTIEIISETFFTNKAFQNYQIAKQNLIDKKIKYAEDSINTSLKDDPSNALSLLLQAEIKMALKDEKTAEKIYAKAFAVNPYNSKTTKNYASLLFDLGKYDDITKKLELYIDPNDESMSNLFARSLYGQQKVDEAILFLNTHLEKQKNHFESKFYLGKFYFETKKDLILAEKFLNEYKKHIEATHGNKQTPHFVEAKEILKTIEKSSVVK